MENSHLPIEVCEHVIDECSNLDRPDRKTLRACALTCSQWLPRSRYNLYQELHWHGGNSAKILDTFSAQPGLAGYVRAIDIWLRKYAPLTQVLSLPLLQKCQRLELNIDWTCFPPRYVHNCLVPLLTNFGSVVELNYTVGSAASAIAVFHIIWAMPQLLSCELNVDRKFMPTAASLANLAKTALRMQPRLCLQTLAFDGEKCDHLPHIQGYPPQGAFGSLVNLTKFEFDFTTAAAVSNSFLQFLGEMVSLEEFAIAVRFKDYTPGGADPLAQVLRYVQSSHLKKCDIHLWAYPKYGCKRGDLLEIISGEAMQQWLQHLPSIPEFIIRVLENDVAFNKDWWTIEITKNLPALKDTLTVDVLYYLHYKHLWAIDPTLPAEAASLISSSTEDENPEGNTNTEQLDAIQAIE